MAGSVAHAAHKTSVLRDQLRELDGRYVPLPKATAQIGSGDGT